MEDFSDSSLVRSFVKKLRSKLADKARNPTYIFTEPRVGYRMAKSRGLGRDDGLTGKYPSFQYFQPALPVPKGRGSAELPFFFTSLKVCATSATNSPIPSVKQQGVP